MSLLRRYKPFIDVPKNSPGLALLTERFAELGFDFTVRPARGCPDKVELLVAASDYEAADRLLVEMAAATLRHSPAVGE